MSPIADAVIVLTCVFASGLLGLSLRRVLPPQHLHEESLSMVRLCSGVIATLAALVLGLLVASAKANYDRVNDEVTHAAVAIVLLDRTLGPVRHADARGPQLATRGGDLRSGQGVLGAQSWSVGP